MKTAEEWAHDIWSNCHVVNGIDRRTAKRIVLDILEDVRRGTEDAAGEWAERLMDELRGLPAGEKRTPVFEKWIGQAIASARDEALEGAALLAHEESLRADRNEGHPGAACRRVMAAIRALKEGK